jgi:hypothetical protein
MKGPSCLAFSPEREAQLLVTFPPKASEIKGDKSKAKPFAKPPRWPAAEPSRTHGHLSGSSGATDTHGHLPEQLPDLPVVGLEGDIPHQDL